MKAPRTLILTLPGCKMARSMCADGEESCSGLSEGTGEGGAAGALGLGESDGYSHCEVE